MTIPNLRPEKAPQGSDPEEKALEIKYRHEMESKRQKIDYIGQLIGSDKEKAGNIAFISILGSIILISLIVLLPINDKNTSKDRFILIPSNIIVLSLGYLFGKK